MPSEQSDGDVAQVDAPKREHDIDAKRIWRCPNCGHEERRHHAAREQPFCDPCDWQHAALFEMQPVEDGEVVDLD